MGTVAILHGFEFPEPLESLSVVLEYSDCAQAYHDTADLDVPEWQTRLCDIESFSASAECELGEVAREGNVHTFVFAVVGEYVGREFHLGPLPDPDTTTCDPIVYLRHLAFKHGQSATASTPKNDVVMRVGDPPLDL